MNKKSLALFVIVALLIAGGVVFYLRSDGQGGAGIGAAAGLGETFVVDHDPALDVTATDRRFDLGGVVLSVSAERPLRAREKAVFTLCIERDGTPQRGLTPELTFNMKMNMGHLNYRLLPTEDGCYRAEAVLPTCMSGGKRWYGRARFSLAGKSYEKVFIFDLQ